MHVLPDLTTFMQLMWVSGPTGRVRKISITLRTVSIAVGILAALLVAAGGILHFVGLRIAIEARPDLARAMGGVLTQAEQDQIEQAYKERLQAIQEKLQTTSDEIVQIQKLKDRFMDIATPSAVKSQVPGGNGKGGNASAAAIVGKRIAAKTMVIGASGSIGSVSARLLAMAFDEVVIAGRVLSTGACALAP